VGTSVSGAFSGTGGSNGGGAGRLFGSSLLLCIVRFPFRCWALKHKSQKMSPQSSQMTAAGVSSHSTQTPSGTCRVGGA
jgi:hypothetical protein